MSMKMFKKLVVGLALFSVVGTLLGASVTVTSTNGPTQILGGGLRSTQFLISNTNLLSTSTWVFFDSPTNVVTFTNAAYTTLSLSAPQTITNSYTNYFGVVNSNVYTAVVFVTNSVAASTNLYPVMFNVIVQSNSTLTVDFAQKWLNGVTVSNTGGGTVTMTYTQ